MKQRSNVKDVESILNQLNLYYEKEKTFNDLKYKNKLRFDYYLPYYNVCIEFNGAQHYEYVEHFHKDKSQFNEQQFKDQIKRNYCVENEIDLIELSCDLTRDEILVKIIDKIENVFNYDLISKVLPMIHKFLNLNLSHRVYINQLYDEYIKMLTQVKKYKYEINYQLFTDYVINYWSLTDQTLIKNDKGDYLEQWINHDVDDMQEMLNDNDIMSQFMIELDDLDVLSYSHIPSFVVYEHYKQWLNNINPGSKPMKMIDFTRKLRKQLLNYGYDDSSRLLLSQIENNQFNFDIFEDMYIDFQKKTTVFINHDLTIEGKQEQLEKDAQELSAEVFQSKYDRKQINAYLHYLNDVNGQKLLSLFLDSNTDYTPDQIHDIPNDELVRIVQSQ